MKRALQLSICLILAGTMSIIAGFSIPRVETLEQSGSVVLSGQSHVEFIIPVAIGDGEASVDVYCYSNSGASFAIFMTRPGVSDYSDGENITAYFNGTGDSIKYLTGDWSECCHSIGNGPVREYAYISRSTGNWGPAPPDTVTIMFFGYNQTSARFPTIPRIINYTISVDVPIPANMPITIITPIIGSIVIAVAMLMLFESRISRKSSPATNKKGTPVTVSKKLCASCTQEIPANQAFCDKCGTKQ